MRHSSAMHVEVLRTDALRAAHPGSCLTIPLEHHLEQVARGGSIMRQLISSLIVTSFCVTGSAAFAQLDAVTDGAKKVGSATKEVGKATVETTKDAAKATEKGTKKVAGETKKAVQTTYRCADGSTDQATLKTNACRDHGGVKAEAKQKR